MKILSPSARTSVWTLALACVLVACSKLEAEPEPIRAVRTVTVTLGSAGGSHEYAAEVRARAARRGCPSASRASSRSARRSWACV